MTPRGKIVLLPEDLTNKIAAGEVIERPASIVKELLENSLDAGATEVSITLGDGGVENIQLADNGEGISPEDVPRAFARFATSKIYRFEDLYAVSSYGFRGEALPSIASIARVEMVTRQKGALAGTRILVTYGRMGEVTEVGCPVGTRISVSDIFNNVPVRKKFLKSPATEQQHCLEVVSRLALPHNHLRVRVESAGKPLLSVPATGDLAERIALFTDSELTKKMLAIDKSQGGCTLRGYVSPPAVSRSNAKQINFYVNNRFVRDHLLQHAVMTAYRNLIEPKRYPLAYLFLDLPPGEVDVNVHPTKLEVRFRRPQDIYHFIVSSLGMTLAGAALTPTAARTFDLGQKTPLDYDRRVREAVKRYTVAGGREKPRYFPHPRPDSDLSDRFENKGALFAEEEPPARPGGFKFTELEYLGQQGDSYLIYSAPEGLVILDQHAAHERIIFERLKRKNEGDGQQLRLLPEVVSLSPADFSFLGEVKDILAEAGLEIEPFGDNSVLIRSLPAFLAGEEPKRLLLDILDSLSVSDRQGALEEKKQKILRSLACRRSFKAGERISPAEAADLCRILDETPHANTCPHGRPLAVIINAADLERMFKRR